jgi:DNA helicase-2/ATP-dependent DNA helicase PcrA
MTMTRRELDAVLGFPTSDEQWACISAPLEPFVIVAGAGTGKTTVMAARVLWLVASGLVRESQVLGLTFTNKAAAELAHRVSDLLARWRIRTCLDAVPQLREATDEIGPADAGGAQPRGDGDRDCGGEPTIATYHSFARRLVDEQGLRVGIEPQARLLSPAAVAQLAYRLVCRSSALVVTTHGPAKVAADVVALDASLAEQTLTTDDVRAHCHAVIEEVASEPRPGKRVGDVARTAARRLELLDLVDDLRAARGESGGLDFSDHMRLCVELVTESPELVASLREGFPVVLLDEYQDTSIAQRVILSTLFAGSAVTAVGDPLQAIYGWRSASVANIEAFGAHFGGPRGPAPTRALSVNRRSGEPILDAANRIAEKLRAAHPEVLPLRAPAPRAATVRAALLPTVLDERAWIVDQIARLVRSGCPPESIGVLGRTNDSLVPLHGLLTARGIPASISGVAALESSPATLCVLSTLRLLADPSDNSAAVALLAGPRWRLSPADIDQLFRRAAELARAVDRPNQDEPPRSLAERIADVVREPDQVELPSLLEAAADPGAGVSAVAAGRLRAFRRELRWLHSRVTEPLPELVAHVLAVTGAHIEADLAQQPGGVGDVALAGLLSMVDGFSDVDGRTGLGAFLAHLAAAELLGSAEEVTLPVLPGSVQLMTMHKAKGLEFPVVVLPHLSRGEFPSAKGMDRWTTQAQVVPFELRDDRHVLPHLQQLTNRGLDAFVDECRSHDRSGDDRLAYVAVTRAQDLLIASGHWWGPSQATPRGPSPYLEILHEHASPTEAEADPWAAAPEPDPSGTPPHNPVTTMVPDLPWPSSDLHAAHPTRASATLVRALLDAAAEGAGPPLTAELPPSVAGWVRSEVAAWDAALEVVVADLEAADEPVAVRTPGVLTASAALELARDPDAFAAQLARPMPRPRNRSAELGTAFHAWVEARLGVQPLITDDLLPGAADEGIASDAELAELKAAFERLPHAGQAPTAIEAPFAVSLGGIVVRGRIDAVFPALPDAPPGVLWDLVDWKTSRQDSADPIQLAIYRVAWAQQQGASVERVRASFVHVRSGRIEAPGDLPDVHELSGMLNAGSTETGQDTRSSAVTDRGTRRRGRSGR